MNLGEVQVAWTVAQPGWRWSEHVKPIAGTASCEHHHRGIAFENPPVLGMPMHILVPAVGFWLKHAWVWKHNPSGMFADWHPKVTCP